MKFYPGQIIDIPSSASSAEMKRMLWELDNDIVAASGVTTALMGRASRCSYCDLTKCGCGAEDY